VVLVDTLGPPTYQQVAPKARHLRELGLSDRTIGRRLGVTDKTVAKAIRWLQEATVKGQPPLTQPSSE
jgi:biotin operon repressor